jgi:hypothetical protein
MVLSHMEEVKEGQNAPIRKRGSQIVWFRRSRQRSNLHCPYCGVIVGGDSTVPSDREHFVGTSFVPSGTIRSTSFNFIFRACRECNAEKGALERHLSSVTLLDSPGVSSHELARAAAEAKAVSDHHPTKQVRMGDAAEKQTISGVLGPATLAFGLVGPPQVADGKDHQLAFFHIRALFALLHMPGDPRSEPLQILPKHLFYIHASYRHSDWGNDQLVEIANRASKWPCYFVAETGDGYFKACMRRSDNAKVGWFWALEWNKSLRLVGAIDHPDSPSLLFQDLPSLKWIATPDPNVRIREEKREPDPAALLFPASLEPPPKGYRPDHPAP